MKVKRKFSQNGFRANFLDLWVKIARSMGAREKRKTGRKDVATNRKFLPNFSVKSKMPTWWSCKRNLFAYASSEKDLAQRMFSSTRQLCTPLPTKIFKQATSLSPIGGITATSMKALSAIGPCSTIPTTGQPELRSTPVHTWKRNHLSFGAFPQFYSIFGAKLGMFP